MIELKFKVMAMDIHIEKSNIHVRPEGALQAEF